MVTVTVTPAIYIQKRNEKVADSIRCDDRRSSDLSARSEVNSDVASEMNDRPKQKIKHCTQANGAQRCVHTPRQEKEMEAERTEWRCKEPRDQMGLEMQSDDGVAGWEV